VPGNLVYMTVTAGRDRAGRASYEQLEALLVEQLAPLRAKNAHQAGRRALPDGPLLHLHRPKAGPGHPRRAQCTRARPTIVARRCRDLTHSAARLSRVPGPSRYAQSNPEHRAPTMPERRISRRARGDVELDKIGVCGVIVKEHLHRLQRFVRLPPEPKRGVARSELAGELQLQSTCIVGVQRKEG
jgi:hypothetical protein